MPYDPEQRLPLRQGDKARTDFAALESDLEAISARPAEHPPLSTQEHWEDINNPDGRTSLLMPACLKRVVRAILGAKILDDLTTSYCEHLFWEIVLTKYIPPLPGKRAIEIGSAPGHFGVKLYRKFGCEPFGLEYTEVGAQLNRETFIKAGIDPGNVFHSDFFDVGFHSVYRASFDVVMSCGFIEHFPDPRAVVDRHIALLKDGGFLIITVPRLRGLNYLLAKLVAPRLIQIQNLEIMSVTNFTSLFDADILTPLWCGLVGGIGIEMVTSHSESRMLRLAGSMVQKLFNLLLRISPFAIESHVTSPHLVFIGTKRRA
jgi:2-polyprenyl-3-methyl-5-hydroxy-6-metoxy-1,4-benzoquinol methylase